MKIGMIGHKVVPSREGGIEIVVEEIGIRMVALGHDVTLYNRKRKKQKGVKRQAEFNGCKIEEIFTINKRSLDATIYALLATLKVRRLAKKGKVDILHFHAEGPCLFLGLLPKKNRKFKLVVTIHGLDWQRGKWGSLATRILKKGEENICKYADEIIVLSENNKRYFQETYQRETMFIPNGVCEPQICSVKLIKSEWGLERDSYVLFLARIVPEKGLHYLIDAWENLIKRNVTNKKLVIAGSASHSNDYYNTIIKRCQNQESIVLTGFVDGQRLRELYSNAYLYVLPSDIEGMPMTFLEALSYGNICLVSDISENAEVADVANVINKCVFTFAHGDEAALEKELEKLLLANLNTHVKPVLPFNWDDVTQKTLDIYSREAK